MLGGGCFCGALRYEIDTAPRDGTICHCADCRRAVGEPGVAWFTVPGGSLRMTAGQPKAFRSSPGAVRNFCGTCGTSLFYAASGDDVDVTTASLDDPEAAPPEDEIRTAERPTWVALCDGRPGFAGWKDAT